MDWYREYRLVEDGDGYTVELILNEESTEFSAEFLTNVTGNLLELDDKIKNLVEEKLSDIKVNSVKLMVGTLVVASIPFIGFSTATQAEAAPVNAEQSATLAATTLDTVGTVTASMLNMRTGPGTTYPVMHVLWQGNKVKVIAQSGDWYQIKLSDGRTGWVSKSYLSVDSRQQKVDKVVATAKSLLGTPYVWGGESLAEGGFDCSGLTQYVFKQVGIQLNRISRDQAKQGITVSRANIQPGDLIFYGFNQDGVINHVGIYIGGGKMIHSPKAGDVVKTTDITTSYWESRFITAKRVIP